MNVKTILILFSTTLLINSCEPETTCGGSLYKGSLEDEVLIISNSDTTNIVIEQSFPYGSTSRDSIPMSYIIEDESTDLIKLKLFVSYESYTKIPDINKESNFYQDTVFIWYSIDEKYNTRLMKRSSILEVECSPTIQYSRIDSIHIGISRSKIVNLESKYLYL